MVVDTSCAIFVECSCVFDVTACLSIGVRVNLMMSGLGFECFVCLEGIRQKISIQ